MCMSELLVFVWLISRLAVLESGLGLKSGLKSFFAGLGLGLGTLAVSTRT